MKRLAELSNQELIELAREQAEEAKKQDAELGTMLAGLFSTVEDMTRRLDDSE
jgi:hypothetical protein